MSLHRAMGPALAVLALAAAAQAQENDLPKFAGVWTVTAAELGGEKAAELIGATFDFDATTAKFTQKGEDGQPVTDAHPFKLDMKTKRLVLYQAPNPEDPKADPKAGMQRGIYKFNGTSLFLCLTAPDATEFPTKFESGSTEEGKQAFLMLKLERPKTAAAPAARTPAAGAKR
ncbi:MAG TPA: TIGR03067 domain-containing protein [Planctomycetaceae bacterium]